MKKTANARRKQSAREARAAAKGTAHVARAEKEVREAMEKCARAWSAGDLDGVMAGYASDALYIVQGQRPFMGTATIREILKGHLRAQNSLRQDITHVHSEGNTAWDDAAYLLQMAQPGGQHKVQRGRRVTLWRRAGRGWRISADVWFAEAAGAGQLPLSPAQLPAQPLPVEARVAQLENAVGQLAHFIDAQLRPNVGLPAQPGQPPAAKPPKEVKEHKDFEKPKE